MKCCAWKAHRLCLVRKTNYILNVLYKLAWLVTSCAARRKSSVINTSRQFIPPSSRLSNYLKLHWYSFSTVQSKGIMEQYHDVEGLEVISYLGGVSAYHRGEKTCHDGGEPITKVPKQLEEPVTAVPKASQQLKYDRSFSSNRGV